MWWNYDFTSQLDTYIQEMKKIINKIKRKVENWYVIDFWKSLTISPHNVKQDEGEDPFWSGNSEHYYNHFLEKDSRKMKNDKQFTRHDLTKRDL